MMLGRNSKVMPSQPVKDIYWCNCCCTLHRNWQKGAISNLFQKILHWASSFKENSAAFCLPTAMQFFSFFCTFLRILEHCVLLHELNHQRLTNKTFYHRQTITKMQDNICAALLSNFFWIFFILLFIFQWIGAAG